MALCTFQVPTLAGPEGSQILVITCLPPPSHSWLGRMCNSVSLCPLITLVIRLPWLLVGPWGCSLELAKSLWQLWQLCLVSLIKVKRARVTYSWPLVDPTGLNWNLQKKWPLVYFCLCMTERGVIHVHEVHMKLPEHFHRGKCCPCLLTAVLCGGNEVFYCVCCDLPWDSWESVLRKYCEMVGGRRCWLLWEMLVLKTRETCYRSLVVCLSS